MLLGKELRSLRGTQPAREVATDLGWSESRLTRLETTSQHPKVSTVTQLLDYYRVSEHRRARILSLVESARRPAPWEELQALRITGADTYLAFEASATSMRICTPQVVPSVLQTAAYARAYLAFRTGQDESALGHVGGIHRQRLARFDEHDAPKIWTIIDESVLYRQLGDAELMIGQLAWLLELHNRGILTLQVLPFSRGPHVGRAGFAVFDFADSIDLEVVCFEGIEGFEFVQDADRVLIYRAVFEQLIAAALPVRQSRQMVEKTIASLTA